MDNQGIETDTPFYKVNWKANIMESSPDEGSVAQVASPGQQAPRIPQCMKWAAAAQDITRKSLWMTTIHRSPVMGEEQIGGISKWRPSSRWGHSLGAYYGHQWKKNCYRPGRMKWGWVNKIMRRLFFVFSQKLEDSTIMRDYLTGTDNKLLQLQI